MSTCLFWTAVLTTVNQAVQRVLMLLTFMVNALVKTNFNSTRHQNFNLRFLFLRSSFEAFEVILATFIITLNWRKPGYSSLLLRKKNTKEINHKGIRMVKVWAFQEAHNRDVAPLTLTVIWNCTVEPLLSGQLLNGHPFQLVSNFSPYEESCTVIISTIEPPVSAHGMWSFTIHIESKFCLISI